MKGSCLLAGLLTFSVVSFAQNTFPTNGNVGIGTTNPLYNLDLVGSLRYGGAGAYTSMVMGTEVSPLSGYNQTNFMIPSTVPGSGHARSVFRFKSYIDSPGANIFDVIVDGNIGIGVTNMEEKLTIDGNVKLRNMGQGYLIYYASLSETVNGASTILGNNVKAGNASSTIKRFANPSDPGSFLSLNYYNGITFHTNIVSGLNTEVASKDNEVMRITHSGNVGIGTSLPDSKLSVRGKIRAQEIKVEIDNWPDYVFAREYQLPTLQETEKHIKEKGHLPGIPSASEVKTNGIDLGDMNAKLLQKIEELTLHLIKQEKEIKALKELMTGEKKRMVN